MGIEFEFQSCQGRFAPGFVLRPDWGQRGQFVLAREPISGQVGAETARSVPDHRDILYFFS